MAKPYVVSLESSEEAPVYLDIARAIAGDIARNRLRRGERLPGSRKLAEMLNVNRNTVHAALRELVAQGWLEAQPARGMFVRAPSEADAPRPAVRSLELRAQVPAQTAFELAEAEPRLRPVADKNLQLTGGVPDPRLFPHQEWTRAYRRAVARRGAQLLDYGEPHGEPSLRRALADMLSRLRGLAASEHDVLITRGSQQAIWLAAHTLLRPGDRVGVEQYGYPPAWAAFRSAGAQLVPLPVDADGVRLDALEAALPLRALYLTPHHQYPTMVALSAQRRLRLLELARQHRCAVLEDDYAHEFHYHGRPRLPLASVDRHGSVVYIGTLSKILMPGLRVGYAVAPRPLIERMAQQRFKIDRQGDLASEAAVAELIEDGTLERHTRRMRRSYEQRRDVLVEALRASLGERVSFELPAGGMALWIRVHGREPKRWVERAHARGVSFRAGIDYTLDPQATVPYVRMGFTRLDERELKRAVNLAAGVF